MNRLSDQDIAFMVAIVQRRQPELLPLAQGIRMQKLLETERETLRGVLADELSEAGLGEDGIINDVGMRLDEIIGKLMFY